MPAALMQHDTDPRDEILAKLGDISELEVLNNEVLCAVYERPERTKGGILLTDTVRAEDKTQGKVALIVKCGSRAFKDDSGKWEWPADIGLGDWIYFRASDGWAITVNGKLCRMVADVDVRGRIMQPDQVW